MTETADERLARGRATAGKLFATHANHMPRFEYPAEIQQDWNNFSVSTVLGDVWSRPGLDMKYRSVATIAALTALNRPEQLRAYIIGGLNLGLTREEVCEVIFQMAVYAGFPAAIQGFAVATDLFRDLDSGGSAP